MKNKITFIVLRNSGSQIHQTSLSRYAIALTGGLLALVLVVLTAMLTDYFILRKEMPRSRVLQKIIAGQEEEIADQREQIQLFADEINALKSHMVALNDFEKQIRIIANIEKMEDQGGGLFGIGGSIPEDLEASLPLESKHNTLLREMHTQVENLELASTRQMEGFESILKQMEEKRNLLASTPAIRPAKGRITSRFGYRMSPFCGKREMHKGLDIAAAEGTPILATADGVVAYAGNKGLLGQTVVIDHGHGMSTRYAHCSKILLQKGEIVKRGDVIARIGNTGRSTGSHLHYEVRLNGVQVNPEKYILNMTPERDMTASR